MTPDWSDATLKHVHRWGTPLYDKARKRWSRLCINGWCPKGISGKHGGGRVYSARPERTAVLESNLEQIKRGQR